MLFFFQLQTQDKAYGNEETVLDGKAAVTPVCDTASADTGSSSAKPVTRNVPPIDQQSQVEQSTGSATLVSNSDIFNKTGKAETSNAPVLHEESPKHKAIRKILESRRASVVEPNSGASIGGQQKLSETVVDLSEGEGDMMNKQTSNAAFAATAVRALGRQNSTVSNAPSLASSLSSSVGIAEVLSPFIILM